MSVRLHAKVQRIGARLAVLVAVVLATPGLAGGQDVQVEFALDEKGEVELQVNVSADVVAPKDAQGVSHPRPLESFQLRVGDAPRPPSRNASRADVRHTFWFPLAGLEPGKKYDGVKLLGEEVELVLEPFIVPGSKSTLRVKLPADVRGTVRDLELLIDDGPVLPALGLNGKEATFDLGALTSVGAGSRIILRSQSQHGKEWRIASSQVPDGFYLPWFVAGGVVLLWALTSAPGRKVVGRWRKQPPIEPKDSPPPTGPVSPPNAGTVGGLSDDLDRLRRTAATTEVRLADLNALLTVLLSRRQGGTGPEPPVVEPPAGAQPTFEPPPPSASKSLTGPLATLRRVIEGYWRGDKGMEWLASVASENGLQLYEWGKFDDVLGTQATSTVDLSFPKWTAESRGPVFLGLKETAGGGLHVVPVKPEGFSPGPGRDALLKLFDLSPSPVGTALRFHSLQQSCLLRPHGGAYRLSQRGVIATGERGAATVGLPGDPPASGGVLETEERRPAARPADGDSLQLRTIVSAIQAEFGPAFDDMPHLRSTSGEILRLLQSIDVAVRALREQPFSGRLPVLALDERQLAAIQAAVLRALDQRMTSTPQAEGATVGQDLTASLPPAENAQSQVESEVPNSLVVGSAVPATGADFSWIAPVLEVAQREIPAAKGPGEYVHALGELEILLANHRFTMTDPARIQYSQVLMDPESLQFTLQRVKLVPQSDGNHKFEKADGKPVISDSVWLVLITVAPAGEETIPSRVALVFPWSRLEKRAPVLARNLVDTVRSVQSEFVRCVAPAVLEYRSQLSAYIVVEKMIVAPVDSELKSS